MESESIPTERIYFPSDTSRTVDRQIWQDDISVRLLGSAGTNILPPRTLDTLKDPMQLQTAISRLILEQFSSEDVRAVRDHLYNLRHVTPGLSSTRVYNPFSPKDTEAAILSSMVVMTDPKVREYLKTRDLRESHQSLQEIWPEVSRKFEIGTYNGIKSGHIPQYVEKRIQPALKQTGIGVEDDVLMPEGATAYYENKTDEIRIRDSVDYWNENPIRILVHELVHKTSGGTFVSFATKSKAKEYYRPRTGFGTEIAHNKYKRTGLNEAVNEHLALGIMYGDFDTIDPDIRTHEDGSYYRYRKVLATFVDRSEGIVRPKTVTRAFYEDTERELDFRERRQLIHETVTAYGYGALRKLDKLFKTSEITYDDDFHKILDCIHSPILDHNGNVIKKGHIDVDALPKPFNTTR